MVASTLSFSPAAPFGAQGSDPEVAKLKTEVEALAKKVESFEAFLTAQEKAGKAFADALSKSEAEGFTAGINPGSREILLEGLRAQADAMQVGAAKDDDEPTGKRNMRGKRRTNRRDQ